MQCACVSACWRVWSRIAACCRRVVRNRLCAARVCASPWAWRATDHSQFSTNRAIVRSFLCVCIGLVDPLSRLSFFRTTAVMERYVRVCASVCADYAVINIPCGWCQGRTRRVNSGHMYIIYDSCCLYTKKAWPVSLLYKSKEKDIIRYYQCVNSVSIERVKKGRVRHHVAGTKQFLRIEWDREKVIERFRVFENELRAMAKFLTGNCSICSFFAFYLELVAFTWRTTKRERTIFIYNVKQLTIGVGHWFMEYRRKIHVETRMRGISIRPYLWTRNDIERNITYDDFVFW